MPQWVLAMPLMLLASAEKIVALHPQGHRESGLIDAASGRPSTYDSPYADIQYLRAHPVRPYSEAVPRPSRSHCAVDLSSMQFESYVIR